MIKIKADILKNFLVKTTANGNITEANINFSKEGLVMQHKDSAGVIAICGILGRTNFLEYQEFNFITRDVPKLLQILKLNKDNVINLVLEENATGKVVSILTESGGISLPVAEKIESFLESVPGLEYDNKILVKKSTFDDIIEKSKIVECDEMKIINAKKELTLSIGKEVGSAYSKALSNLEAEKETSFNLAYFKLLVDNFDAVLDFSIDANLPSKFEEKTDKYNVIYFLTPLSVEETTKEKEA